MDAPLRLQDHIAFQADMLRLGEFELFRDTKGWVERNDVWARPLRPQTFKHLSFAETTEETRFDYTAFTMTRALTALIEQDFLYLPERSPNIVGSLRKNYNEPLRALAAGLIPGLEERTLGFVENQIYVSEGWTTESFRRYFADKIAEANGAAVASFSAIRNAKDPRCLAKTLLIQHAVDFLPESSHMARYAKGDYGEIQSAIFRVMIDEYGYGAHRKKHSELFKKTLMSIEMASNSHAYWMFYLNSTLLSNNYFHTITRCPEKAFEYIGAITYAENTFSSYCDGVARLLEDCFGSQVDTGYYKEHVHIDGHHARMTLEELVLPAISQFGEAIIPEIIRGIETAARLQEIAEEDLSAQLAWMDQAADYRKLARHIKPRAEAWIDDIPVAHLDEPEGELSVTHCHDGDELCVVDEGVLRFCHGYDLFSDLASGECVVIKKNRLHGALVLSERCKYRILSIGRYQDYADYQI